MKGIVFFFMREATNIERILFDVKDLAQSVANGNECIVSAYFNGNDDLVVVTEDGKDSYDWTIGFGESDNEEDD